MYRIEFGYGNLGFGRLRVIDTTCGVVFKCNARTGSISNGKLINALPRGLWYGKTKPVYTKEESMIIKPEIRGWKFRLYDQFKKRTSYLIHPDGNKPGTLGCIGVFGMHWELRSLLNFIMYQQKGIKIFV